MVVIKDLKRTAQSNPWNGIATVMVALQLLLGCIFYSHQQHGVSNFAKSAIDTSSTMLRSHLDVAQQQPGGSRELEGTMEVLITDLFEATSSERLADIANEYSEQYATNSPFPHIAIDNIFPIEYLYKVKEEHPESDAKRIYESGDCKSLTTTTGANCKHDKTTTRKSAINNESDMGMYTKILLSTMKSSTFIHFLEELTGISNLIPDPHYFGSGIHHTDGQGGKLDIHADFNRLNDYDLDRRVNVFIYLNDNWKDEYGGALELWSKDMKSCMQRIQASLGRFIVFSTTDFSYHGHPEPMTAPDGRVRQSIALYYYSNGRPDDECLGGSCKDAKHHSTLYQTPQGCKKCKEKQCKKFDENKDIPFWVDEE